MRNLGFPVTIYDNRTGTHDSRDIKGKVLTYEKLALSQHVLSEPINKFLSLKLGLRVKNWKD